MFKAINGADLKKGYFFQFEGRVNKSVIDKKDFPFRTSLVVYVTYPCSTRVFFGLLWQKPLKVGHKAMNEFGSALACEFNRSTQHTG